MRNNGERRALSRKVLKKIGRRMRALSCVIGSRDCLMGMEKIYKKCSLVLNIDLHIVTEKIRHIYKRDVGRSVLHYCYMYEIIEL